MSPAERGPLSFKQCSPFLNFSVCLSVYLSVRPSVHPFVRLSVYMTHRLKSSVRVIREAGWLSNLELIQHEKWIQVSQLLQTRGEKMNG